MTVSTAAVPTTVAHKDAGQARQKQLLAEYYARLAHAPQTGRKCVYTFVPGNLNELLLSFDLLPVFPELNALQSGIRGQSGRYISLAESAGHSEDVCTYVKCDLGRLRAGNVGPLGSPLPPPDLLLLSYTGCLTFVKWFELLRAEFDCPVVMLHVPYQSDGRISDPMRRYVVDQLRGQVIPALERLAGTSYDESRLQRHLGLSAAAETDFAWVLDAARHRPSPLDAFFGGVYYVAPLFTAFRGTAEGRDYYRDLRQEIADRLRLGQGPIAPDGQPYRERFRVVVEGPPSWTSFHETWSMFRAEGAVAVASTYTKVGGVFDRGFRHDASRPLESLAEYCLGCYTNLGLPARIDLLAEYVRHYEADGFLIHSVKGCRSFSAGQLLILRELEKRTGIPGGFLEGDLVDARYVAAANVRTRLESYFQMLDQRTSGARRK